MGQKSNFLKVDFYSNSNCTVMESHNQIKLCQNFGNKKDFLGYFNLTYL